MKKEKNIAIYCRSAQDYKKLAEHTDREGYSWGHNGKLSEWNPIENLSKNNPIVIYLNIITKRITYGWKIKPEHISVDEYSGCIKPEFRSDFKRMFRVNRIPSTLSPEQLQKMSEEKVLKLWKI